MRVYCMLVLLLLLCSGSKVPPQRLPAAGPAFVVIAAAGREQDVSQAKFVQSLLEAGNKYGPEASAKYLRRAREPNAAHAPQRKTAEDAIYSVLTQVPGWHVCHCC